MWGRRKDTRIWLTGSWEVSWLHCPQLWRHRLGEILWPRHMQSKKKSPNIFPLQCSLPAESLSWQAHSRVKTGTGSEEMGPSCPFGFVSPMRCYYFMSTCELLRLRYSSPPINIYTVSTWASGGGLPSRSSEIPPRQPLERRMSKFYKFLIINQRMLECMH